MLFSLRLEADHNAFNRHRVYQLDVERDLLGDVLVTITHGRRGQPLVGKSVLVPDLAAAQSLVRSKLRRRASAPRRIGCSYRITELAAIDDPTPFLLEPKAAKRLAAS